jgi:hypothetical protein
VRRLPAKQELPAMVIPGVRIPVSPPAYFRSAFAALLRGKGCFAAVQCRGFFWGVSLAGRKHLIVDQKIAGSTPARLANCFEERMNMMRNLKEMVSNNQVVRFTRFRDGELFYRTECGFEFPVPIADTGGAEFLAEDKALLFMRYIRKKIERIAMAREAQAAS